MSRLLDTPLPLSPAYRGAIKTALALQLCITPFLLLLLDGGRTAKVGGFAMIGFWLGAAIVMTRRPRSPRASDLLYIRWGYLLVLIIGIIIAANIDHLRG